jgi:hypothetical protein
VIGEGAIDAEADHKKKEAVVRYDPVRVTPERVKQDIEKLWDKTARPDA